MNERKPRLSHVVELNRRLKSRGAASAKKKCLKTVAVALLLSYSTSRRMFIRSCSRNIV